MPAPYGITSTGFNAKTTEEIHDEVDEDFKGILGEGAGTEPDGSIPLDSPEGQLKTLIVDGYAELWELGEAIAASYDPNQASDSMLDAAAAQTGTVRNEETYSTVDLYCLGDYGTVLPAGRLVRTNSTLEIFESQSPITLGFLIARSNTTSYAKGDVAGVGAKAIVCVTAGITGSSFPGGSVGDIVTDGTVEWYILDDTGASVGVMSMTAQNAGPVGAPAYDLTDIRTPVAGWDSAINLFDAAVGQNQESDALFRARRDGELAGQGGGTPDAIRAAILRVNAGSIDPDHQPPTVVKVFYNDTDYTDSNGLPPHSVEVLVRNGTDADIAQALFDCVAAGTYTHGNQTSEVVDSEGYPQIVRWSRPEEVPIYAALTVRYDPASWPQGSEQLVAQYALSAFLTYTNEYPIARDVRVSPLNAGTMRGPAQVDESGQAVIPAATGSNPVPGLLEVEEILISTAPAPSSSAQVPIQSRQVAVFDSSRTTVVATTEDP